MSIKTVVQFPNRGRNSYLGQHVQTGSGPVDGYRTLVPEVKQPEHETDHSTPLGAEVKKS
jgi:hypothetical protein